MVMIISYDHTKIEIRNRYKVKHMDLSDVNKLIAYNSNTYNSILLIPELCYLSLTSLPSHFLLFILFNFPYLKLIITSNKINSVGIIGMILMVSYNLFKPLRYIYQNTFNLL